MKILIKILLLSACCVVTFTPLMAQSIVELYGTILNSDSQPIIGAVISVEEMPQRGAMTNADGEYSLLLPTGKYTIVIQSMGYEPLSSSVVLKGKSQNNYTLKTDNIQINQVVVSAVSAREKLDNVQIGVEAIDIQSMAKSPALFGENDIIKSITLLPGIKSDGDGSSGFQVRGGTASQNIILLDDAPIYNSGHVLGIFSVFNDDALASANLYKGQIPAMFGGATSSVFDIHSRTGDAHKFKAGFDLGLLSTKAFIETPIVEDKLSLFVSARRSYFDLFLLMTDEYSGNSLHFYDVNAKLNYNINENNILSLSYFRGQDMMGLEDLMELSWGNNALSLNLFHRYSERLSSSTSLISSDYETTSEISLTDIDCTLEGYIKNWGLKHNFSYIPNENHTVDVGFQTTKIDLKSAEWLYYNILQSERRDGWESSVWVNERWKINERVDLSVGLRLNNFLALGGSPYYEIDSEGNITETLEYASGEVVVSYLTLEPRMSLNVRLSSQESLKLGYSRSSQNIHAISNGSTTIPFNRYAMSSNIIKPEISDQLSLGYVRLSDDERFEYSIEGYFKIIDNVYDYKDGKTFTSAIELETLLLGGRGRAYGIETSVKKNVGVFTGWVGYTLSWVENKIEGINGGEWYTASNDRRHDISVVAMVDLQRGWSASANFVYNTGQALTAPSAKYEIEGSTIYYYAERNGYRAPSYHRLDISFTHTKQKRRHVREWNLGFYNLYNHYNPYMILFENDSDSATGTTTTQYSLFGIIPSFTYSLTF